MKKIFILLFFLSLVIFLSSCSKGNTNPGNDNINEDEITDDEGNDDQTSDEEDPIDEENPIDEEDLIITQQAQSILDTLTLEQKVGQMFIVGFNGTSMPKSLENAINNYKFGNFIYFGNNVADDQLVVKLSNDIQNTVMNSVGVPGFISMDQEGGMVVRFANKATHFIGGMGLAATNNPENAFNVGKYSGEELRHFGVNLNLAPVLDVNNNPNNPVIGIRSFSDDPEVVSQYGIQMIKGLHESNVMATAKHFPGHGDTSVDSHYGLPMITHSLEDLYKIELYPYVEAIDNGIDAIMTAHIIFSALDNTYPATLSSKVVTGLLREELGFDGIVMTDSMNMQAISSNFGVEEAAILSIKAGVDMLLYGESSTLSVQAYLGVLEALRNKTLDENRINESVLRILKKKIKLHLIDDYLPKNNLSEENFNEHFLFNENLIRNSITMPKGNVDSFSSSKSTLFISSVCTRYPLVDGYSINTNNNSLAYVSKNYFSNLGMSKVDYEVIGTTVSTYKISEIVEKAKGYDQIVIGLENISSSQANLVNGLLDVNNNLIYIALRNPYDINSIPSVNNYICTYGYFASSINAIFDLLNKEFVPQGRLPVFVSSIN